ncbi:unnamed protein product [Periconia digitata]|uniref:Uncharacterized protein n=1 Tax=Periconia digitata TaxID=1303443 RepID=A0A9W4ULK3_9PLEO|nr:unnamed protein product [Periconia digitata]
MASSGIDQPSFSKDRHPRSASGEATVKDEESVAMTTPAINKEEPVDMTMSVIKKEESVDAVNSGGSSPSRENDPASWTEWEKQMKAIRAGIEEWKKEACVMTEELRKETDRVKSFNKELKLLIDKRRKFGGYDNQTRSNHHVSFDTSVQTFGAMEAIEEADKK